METAELNGAHRTTLAMAASIHLMTLAVCTYVASVQIESVIVTGWICAVTGLALGAEARRRNRRLLSAAGFATPALAMLLLCLEAGVLNLGPRRAALPFCIVFFINHTLTAVVILVEINRILAPADARSRQITISTLLVSTLSFSVFFAIARLLDPAARVESTMTSAGAFQAFWLSSVAMGLAGLTGVGLVTMLHHALTRRRAQRPT